MLGARARARQCAATPVHATLAVLTLPRSTDPACISMPATTDDSRVLRTPTPPRSPTRCPTTGTRRRGRGGFQCRAPIGKHEHAGLRAKFRISSFWAASPDSSTGDVTTHWIADGGDPLVVRQGETRCILVSAGTGAALAHVRALPPVHGQARLGHRHRRRRGRAAAAGARGCGTGTTR